MKAENTSTIEVKKDESVQVIGDMTEHEKVEQLIKIAYAGENVRIRGMGNSMRPLLHGGRDFIYLSAIDEENPLAVGDVVLYFSFDKYKIHRIMKITPEGYVIAGDGNQFLEPPLPREQIFLRAIGFLRNDKYISVEMAGYKIYSFLWRVAFKVRPIIRRIKWLLNIIRGKERDI